ncbi:hypothetical protein [Vibrio hepatarius]|uniref:hypothetical protein n=1 Tax=Vibrio hepatarius TaxID=171383 RepID=UPI001C09D572|nr:hypothetical protein [Vibrio hepatarius]MBU2895679.1 hypothetical protein [Vibrio hepatarius]
MNKIGKLKVINRLIFTQDGFHEEITRKSDINKPILGYKSSEIVGVIATREVVNAIREIAHKLNSKIDKKLFLRIIGRSFVVNELPKGGIQNSEQIDINASVYWMDRENGLLNDKARLIEEECATDRVTSEQQRVDSEHYRQQSGIVLLMADGTQLGTIISLQHSQAFLHWLTINLNQSHKDKAKFDFDSSVTQRFDWTAFSIRKVLTMKRSWFSSFLVALGNGIIVSMAFLYVLSVASGNTIQSIDCPEHITPIVLLIGMTLRIVPPILPLWMFGTKGNLCNRLMNSELK